MVTGVFRKKNMLLFVLLTKKVTVTVENVKVQNVDLKRDGMIAAAACYAKYSNYFLI